MNSGANSLVDVEDKNLTEGDLQGNDQWPTYSNLSTTDLSPQVCPACLLYSPRWRLLLHRRRQRDGQEQPLPPSAEPGSAPALPRRGLAELSLSRRGLPCPQRTFGTAHV